MDDDDDNISFDVITCYFPKGSTVIQYSIIHVIMKTIIRHPYHGGYVHPL